MDVAVIFLLIGAAVCFLLGALRVTVRLELVALGLLFLTAASLLPAAAAL